MKFFETTHIGEGLKSSSDLQRTFGVYRDAFVVPRAGSIRLVQSDCLLYKFTPGEKKETNSGPWCGYLAFRGCCCVCLYRQDSVYIVAWQVLSVASVWDLVKFVVDVYLETST